MIDKQLLLLDLVELLEEPIERLTDDYPLDPDGLWDSLTLVSTLAMIQQHYQLMVKGAEIEPCRSIGELFGVITQKQTMKNLAEEA